MGIFTPFAYRQNKVLQLPILTETQNFITASGITDNQLIKSINRLIFDLQNEEVWEHLEMVYPFVSDNTASVSTQFSYNLINTGSYILSFPNGISGSNFDGFNTNETGQVFGSTTYLPTGSTAYFGVYTNTFNTDSNAARVDLGAYGLGGSNRDRWVSTGRSLTDGNTIKSFYAGASGSVTTGPIFILDSPLTPNEIGFFQYKLNPEASGSSSGSLAVININGGSEVHSILFPFDNIQGAANASTLTIGGARAGNLISSGSTDFSNKKYQMIMAGINVPNDKLDTIYTIVQAFQSSVDIAMGTNRTV
jgi:hypothetical protein